MDNNTKAWLATLSEEQRAAAYSLAYRASVKELGSGVGLADELRVIMHSHGGDEEGLALLVRAYRIAGPEIWGVGQ